MNGLIVKPGQGRRLVTPAQDITFKVTGADGSFASTFELIVPPGFDCGAHIHTHSEFFYVLEGELDLFAFEPVKRTQDRWQEWESADGDRIARAGAGGCMFVPSGCPHAFANLGREPVRMLFQSFPAPDHEHYFDELAEIFASGPVVDASSVERLRDRYHLTQLTPLRYEPTPVR